MKLVDRHIGLFFFKLYLASALGLVSAGMLLEISELPARLAEGKGLAAVLRDLLWFVPPFYANFSPLAVLLAGSACFSLMAKYREILVLNASGFRPFRIWLPAAAASLLLVIPPLAVNETLVPEALSRERTGRDISSPIIALPGIFISGEKLELGRMIFHDLTMVSFGPGGNISEVYLAEKAIIEDRAEWTLEHGSLVRFSNGGLVTGRIDFEEAAVPVPFSAGDIPALVKPLETLSGRELRAYLRTLDRAGLDPPPVRTYHYSRYSYQLLNLSVAFLFLPLIFGRRRSRPVLITASLVSGFALYWIFSFCLALGNRGAMAPLTAVTLPHLAAVGLGAVFFFFSEERGKKPGERAAPEAP